MKVIERDELTAKKEEAARAKLADEEKARELWFKTQREDPLFRKYIIDELVQKELDRITNIEWMYSSEHLGESSNSKIGEIMRRNSVVYRLLKNILKPILGND